MADCGLCLSRWNLHEPLSGRRAQARRNDARIREAAREVFTADPDAPMSAVAARAGVGISALYRRYASKEDLLRQVARDGLARYLEEAETAAADDRDPWDAFVAFMERLLEAQTVAITMNLAGTFAPTEELYAMAERAAELNEPDRRPDEGRGWSSAGHRRRRPVADPRAGVIDPPGRRAADPRAPPPLPGAVPRGPPAAGRSRYRVRRRRRRSWASAGRPSRGLRRAGAWSMGY